MLLRCAHSHVKQFQSIRQRIIQHTFTTTGILSFFRFDQACVCADARSYSLYLKPVVLALFVAIGYTVKLLLLIEITCELVE